MECLRWENIPEFSLFIHVDCVWVKTTKDMAIDLNRKYGSAKFPDQSNPRMLYISNEDIKEMAKNYAPPKIDFVIDYDQECGEYTVRVFVDGEENIEAAYYTDDLDDAIETYQEMKKSY